MTAPTDLLTRKLATLSDAPGVYLWKDAEGGVLYVGKAKSLRSRVRSYVQNDHLESPKLLHLMRLAADVETILTGNEAESLLLENNLIKEYQPRFNARLKDDKSYPSIAVTLKEPFPRVLVTRRRDLPGARYYGPYTDVSLMRRTLGIVRRIFTVRSCPDDLPRERRERPCLDFHIGRCKAPCVGWQSQEDYRAMIGEVVAFLEGETADVRGHLRAMMTTAADREDFERAKELRDTLKWVEQLESPGTVEQVGSGDADAIGFARDGDDAAVTFFRVRDGRVVARDHRFLENVEGESDETILSAWLVQDYRLAEGRARKAVLPFPPEDLEQLAQLLPDVDFVVPLRGAAARWRDLADQNARHLLESLRIESFETDERAEDPVYALGRDLGLQIVPRSLICVDISTNQGRDTVGSLVWFEAGRPKKSEYRKYKIKGEAQQDDFAAIHEVVTRFLTRRREEKKPFPDLIVIDGGKGQLSAAQGALQALALDAIPLVSLAKREEEIFVPGRAESLRLPRRSPSLRLLQRARDEAHRFGVAFNRKRRTARTITSELLEVPGVGPTKRRQLLETFGSLAGVKSATPIEIAAVPGFSQKLAERVLEHLRKS